MMLKRILLFAICAAAAAFAGNNRYSETKSQTWDLPANSKLEIHVSGADVSVVEGEAAKVSARVLMKSDSPEFARQVAMTFDMQGSLGTLRVKQPSHGGNLTIKISVPVGTEVAIRATAGDIDVDTTGSKDIDTTAGDVRVTVGSAKEYAAIDVSTRAGDVSGDTCGKAKGWIGSSLHCSGEGKDRIKVHTLAGDVMLREKSAGTAMSKE